MYPKIIQNKKILMTDAEWKCYQEICKSYSRENFNGEDIFKGLIETDNQGLIIFINPPREHYTSMEAYLFICSLFHHQQERIYKKQIDELVGKYEKKLVELENKIAGRLEDVEKAH